MYEQVGLLDLYAALVREGFDLSTLQYVYGMLEHAPLACIHMCMGFDLSTLQYLSDDDRTCTPCMYAQRAPGSPMHDPTVS